MRAESLYHRIFPIVDWFSTECPKSCAKEGRDHAKISNMEAKERQRRMSVSFEFDIDKAIAATVYIGSHRPVELTQAKLFKLLYFADKDHLVRYARPITGDWYAAMKDGPVPSHLYNAFKGIDAGKTKDARLLARNVSLDRNHQFPWIEIKSDWDRSQLSTSDIHCLDRVIEAYGRMTFSQVRAIAHDTAAWGNAWSSKPEEKDANPMLFEDFFEDDFNAILGVREEMLENDGLKKTLGRA
jgi:uncharacterized phage-associated protein